MSLAEKMREFSKRWMVLSCEKGFASGLLATGADELDRLVAVEKDNAQLRTWLHESRTQLAAAQAQLAEARRDAERYIELAVAALDWRQKSVHLLQQHSLDDILDARDKVYGLIDVAAIDAARRELRVRLNSPKSDSAKGEA